MIAAGRLELALTEAMLIEDNDDVSFALKGAPRPRRWPDFG